MVKETEEIKTFLQNNWEQANKLSSSIHLNTAKRRFDLYLFLDLMRRRKGGTLDYEMYFHYTVFKDQDLVQFSTKVIRCIRSLLIV